MSTSSWKRRAAAGRNSRTIPKLDSFSFSKSLLTGLTYPHDWGFVPSTKADDDDPLDIMVVHDAATFPGIVMTCRVIGILEASPFAPVPKFSSTWFFCRMARVKLPLY
jgi:inorganic pyrophosphatase